MILLFCRRERDPLRRRCFSGMCLIGMGSVLLAQSGSSKPLKVFGAAAGALGVARLTSVWQLKQQKSQSVPEDSRESHKCVQ